MTYSQPPIQFSQDNFAIQANTVSPAVIVKYNGSGIHNIAGPVPLVSINKNINRNAAGEIENISTNINLTGKIVRYNPEIFNDPYGSGISSIVKAVDDLRNIFTSCPISTFEIVCNNSPILSVGGVKVKSFTTDKSPDNWVYTADYTVELEYFEPAYPGAPLVSNMSDSWTVEPLEDYVYSSFSRDIQQRVENHNPNLHPNGNANQSLNAAPNGPNSYVNVINVPQFRISHKISAVGLATSNQNCVQGHGNRAYLEAKKWVEERAGVSLNYSLHSLNTDGLQNTPHFTDNPNLSNFTNTFLYNHMRNINFSINDGNYEINDTWLAMPIGIKYTEDYTLEVSTDEKFVKSVRVQGNIRGLNLSSFNVQQASEGVGLAPNDDGLIDISYSTLDAESGGLSGADNILDLAGSNTTIGNTSTLSKNKYENALDAWIVHIKPYLYKRACLGVNSSDRDHNYTEYNNTINNKTLEPFNPAYIRENLLNIIPRSTSEGHDPRKGTISYSYEYDNTTRLINGVLSENISINNTAPADVISQTQVLGRELGPILQKTGKTPTTTSFTIDIVVVPPRTAKGFLQTQLDCPLYTGGYIYQQINSLIESFKPFGNLDNNIFSNTTRNQNGTVYTESDGESWSPTTGHYSRNITWIYQRCSVSTNYMDH